MHRGLCGYYMLVGFGLSVQIHILTSQSLLLAQSSIGMDATMRPIDRLHRGTLRYLTSTA